MGKYQVAPPLAKDDLDRLAASIRERGVQTPILVDETGEIIDGHHRAMIADSLGIECPKEVCAGLSDEGKLLLAIELNLARRHLTDAQKVLMGRQIEPLVRAIVERQRIGRMRQSRWGRADAADDSAQMRRVIPGTEDEVARRVGLGSRDTYYRGKKVIAEAEAVAPEFLPAVEKGEMGIIDLKRVVERRKAERLPASERPAVDPAIATREVRRWMEEAHRALGRLRELRARFGAALGRGVEGEVLADELARMAAEVAALVEDIRRQQGEDRTHDRTAG